MDVLSAIVIPSKTWKEVSSDTIRNCFRRARIVFDDHIVRQILYAPNADSEDDELSAPRLSDAVSVGALIVLLMSFNDRMTPVKYRLFAGYRRAYRPFAAMRNKSTYFLVNLFFGLLRDPHRVGIIGRRLFVRLEYFKFFEYQNSDQSEYRTMYYSIEYSKKSNIRTCLLKT